MKRLRFARPPRQLSRQRVKLDNIALIPASLLPYKEQWQEIVGDLPEGNVLIVLPGQAKQQRVIRSVASQFRQMGKYVSVISKVHRKGC